MNNNLTPEVRPELAFRDLNPFCLKYNVGLPSGLVVVNNTAAKLTHSTILVQ